MVAVVFFAGNQVPVTPLLDVVGNVKVLPEHSGAIAVNVGTIVLQTVRIYVFTSPFSAVTFMLIVLLPSFNANALEAVPLTTVA